MPCAIPTAWTGLTSSESSNANLESPLFGTGIDFGFAVAAGSLTRTTSSRGVRFQVTGPLRAADHSRWLASLLDPVAFVASAYGSWL